MNKFTLTILCSLGVFNSEASELDQIPFEHLEAGSEISIVRCIYRDSDDYLWIGHDDGLVKYGNNNIMNLKHEKSDSNTIAHNIVVNVIEDDNKNIWISTYNGVSKLNKVTGEIDNYLTNIDIINEFNIQIVYQVYQDTKKRIWVGAGSGLYEYSYEKDSMIYHHLPLPDTLRNITSIQEDSKGKLWLGCRSDCIIKYDVQSKKSNLYTFGGVFQRGKVDKKILIDKNDEIWIAQQRTCFSYFDPIKKKFKHYFINKDGTSLNSREVFHIAEYDDDHIFIATDQGGINVFNKKTSKFSYISSFKGNAGKLTSDGILYVYKDIEGIIWVGTSRGGVCYYNPKEHYFKVYRKKDIDYYSPANKSLSNGVVGCLLEDSDGLIWIGTDGGGINILDRKTGYIKIINTENSALRYNTIRSLAEDVDGNIVICAWPNTFDKYIRDTGQIVPMNVQVSFQGEYFWTGSVDYKNRLWVTSVAGDIAMLENGKVAYYKTNENNGELYESPKVYCSTHNKDIHFLLPGKGLFKWNEASKDFNEAIFESNDILINVLQDKDENYWVGTANKGVFLYNKNTGDSIVYNTSNGLSDNKVKALLIDDFGDIWVSTNDGLNQISLKDNTIYTYLQEDGLQGNKYFTVSCLKGSNGEMFFGGNKGLDTFFPEKIKRNKYLSKVFIDKVNVVSQNKKENLVLVPQNSDTIQLKWFQSRIEIFYNANNYTFNEKTKYKYILTNSEGSRLVQITRTNHVFFNYLKPGNYKFEVFAANSDGLWNEEGYSLYFRVKEKMWKRTWFYILLAFLILFTIYVIILLREKNLRRTKKLLEEKVKVRTRTIEKQNDLLIEQHDELFAQKEELQQHKDHLENMVGERTAQLFKAKEKAENSDRLKSYFLANMSHEIRTPMNAIIGFSSLLEDDSIEEEDKHGFIELIVRNSNALLLLIEDILDFSQIEANQLKIRKEEFSVNRLLDEVYSTFCLRNENPLVEIKKENQLKAVYLRLYSDEYRIRQVLFNLMGNALKFTKGGSVSIGVTTVDSNVKFYVKDTGIGMSEGEVKVIFNQFVKLNRDQVSAKRGIGLGLAISKRLAKLLGGDLSVESKPNQGSTFILNLPYEQSLEELPKKAKENHLASTVNWENKRILVVEDEQANFKFLKELLKKTKVKIDYVENGLQAVKNCDKCDKYDVVLMDIRMPIMNGYEALMKIKEACKKQIVIAQTAYARPEDKVKIKEAGFTDYLTKPFLPKDIVNLLQKYLDA